MDDFERLLREFGPWIPAVLFVYAFVKTGPLPIAAGYAATLGWVDPVPLLVALWAGAALGDLARFELGRRLGPAALARLPAWQARWEPLSRVLVRHYGWVCLAKRFAKGIRTPISVGFGLTAIGRWRFGVITTLTAGIWAGSFVGAGMAAGRLAGSVSTAPIAAASLVLLIAIVAALGWLVQRELRDARRRFGDFPHGRAECRRPGMQAETLDRPAATRPGPARATRIEGWLERVERIGNALPHPVALFALLAAAVVLLSDVTARAGLAVPHPATGDTVRPVSLLTIDGLHRMITELVRNFTGFAPLGVVWWRCSASAWRSTPGSSGPCCGAAAGEKGLPSFPFSSPQRHQHALLRDQRRQRLPPIADREGDRVARG